MKDANTLLHRAARIAKRRGVSLTFTAADLGDLYHVYGVNATATKLVDMLEQREVRRRLGLAN